MDRDRRTFTGLAGEVDRGHLDRPPSLPEIATSELDAYPLSVQGLQDAAVLDSALGRVASAAVLLRTARRLEPLNPVLRRPDPGPAL